jgi:CheY-like chemotaxis protein
MDASMTEIPEFLLVDDNVDNRFLLAKTLIRKFPTALLQECQDSQPALVAARRPSLTAAIVHRATDVDGLTLVEMLRKTRPTLPILFVSGADMRAKAFEMGASAFLNYDAWLRVGAVVDDMLRTGASSAPFTLGAQPA